MLGFPGYPCSGEFSKGVLTYGVYGVKGWLLSWGGCCCSEIRILLIVGRWCEWGSGCLEDCAVAVVEIGCSYLDGRWG